MGTYKFTTSYAGNSNFTSSSTVTATRVTVAKASSATLLRIATAKTYYGRERSDRLVVKVSLEFAGARMRGTVIVSEAGNALCAIAISPGTSMAACRLLEDELPVGSFKLIATYSGNGDFHGSVSAKVSLEVESPSSVVIPGS